MIEYITVADVDDRLGPDWTIATKKNRAVMLANLWLTGQDLQNVDPIPEAVKQAGAEIAQEAAAGRIFAKHQTGVLSESVRVDVISKAKTLSGNSKTYTAGESVAMALLKPYLGKKFNGIMFLKKI